MSAAYTVDVRRLDEFSAADLYDMLKLRVDVFVVEQHCPYPELDGNDKDCLHLRAALMARTCSPAARLWRPLRGAASPHRPRRGLS
ncbi:MAG: hypothetical protein U5N27_05575 [Rhizobium sp.]|nr:hypothetical protein [Rhizobium sp.]